MVDWYTSHRPLYSYHKDTVGDRDIDDIGGFLEWGYPRMHGLTIENHTTMEDDWGYHHFSKPPYGGYTMDSSAKMRS